MVGRGGPLSMLVPWLGVAIYFSLIILFARFWGVVGLGRLWREGIEI